MAFYTDFAGHYDKIFPVRESTWRFLDRWLPESGEVLDLGCGVGHYSGRLAASGRSCLGLDLDPGMVGRAEAAYPQARFLIMGLEDIGVLEPASRDGIVCIGNVLPHLPAVRLEEFLDSVRRLLRPGGRWILQTVNFDPLMHLDEHAFRDLEVPEEKLVFHRRYQTRHDGNITFRTRLARAGQTLFSGETILYPRLSHQYRALHRAAGFDLLAHFADFSEAPFVGRRSAGSVFVFEAPAG